MPACCPPKSWPQLLCTKEELNKDDVPAPKGSLVTAPGTDLPIYFCEPTGPSKGSILVIPDIYSVRVLTTQVRSGDRIGCICDMLAEAGYTVALAGLFRDKPFDLSVNGPDDGDFEKFNSFAQDGGVAWFQAHSYEKIGPDMQATAKFLSDKTGGQALGVLGFCFGTWALSKTASMGDVDFSCAVGCHPATVLETAVHGGDEVKMLESLKMPTKFLWAGNDSEIFKEGGAGKAALEKSGGGVEAYPDMLHGWVSRGDMAEEKVKRDVKKAIESILGFFEEKMPKA